MPAIPSHSRLAPRAAPRLHACVLALALAFAVPAHANPTGAAVVAGQASIIHQGNLTTITNSNGAIINWQSFSIGRDETTRFVQPSSAASVLNRVVGPDPSTLLGRLQSNGRVFLINPAGILVGTGARIDVPAFVASTLNLRNEDFLANRLNFQANTGAGTVRNEGAITTSQGGQVYLVAPRVENAGSIAAPGGEVVLAAGRTVQIGDTASPGVRIEVAAGETAQNIGSVAAAAGRIGLFGALVKNSGSLDASSAVAEGGKILLKSTGDTVVDGNASLTATGSRGGRVEVLGNRVGLSGQASINASGRNAGGTVLVGGDYQGKNPEVQNAQATWVGPQTSIRADATEAGNGGKVVVWADDATRAYGSVSARGGPAAGDGGLIETSGKRFLDVEGIRVSAGASNGTAGTWLLDPEELSIINNGSPGTDINVTTGPNFAPSGTLPPPTLSSDTLNAALNGGATSVIITTGSGGAGTGDITFDASSLPILISKDSTGSSTTLSVNAFRNVIFTGGATTFRTQGAGSGSLDVNLNAGNGNNTGAANVFTNATATVNVVGTAAAPVGVTVGNGKTWINNGTVNLVGAAGIKLPTGLNQFPAPPLPSTPTNMAATFSNVGTFNNASTALTFVDGGASRNGVFDNAGVFVSTNGGGLAGIFKNQASATLNVSGSRPLALADASLLLGSININGSTLAAGGNLILPSTGVTFSGDVVLAAGGNLVLAGGNATGAANLSLFAGNNLVVGNANVDAAHSVSLGAANAVVINNATVGTAAATGTSISSAGTLNILNGSSVGNSGAPTKLSTGFANISGASVSGSDVTVNANNLLVAGGSISASDKLRAVVARDIMLDSTTSDSSIGGVNAVNLALASIDSTLSLAGSASGRSTVGVNGPAGSEIRVFFSARTSGGIVVDGAQGIGPGSFNSGFEFGRAVAQIGSNLFVSYGGFASDVCKTLPGLCVVRAAAGLGLIGPPPPRPVVKEDPDGLGSFGEQAAGASPVPGTGPQKKRPGVCKAA